MTGVVSPKQRLVAFQRLGAEIFAPLFAAHARWVHAQAKRDGVTQLLFLARDGYMLQQAYHAVIAPAEQIPSQYMYASRRLFNFAAIRELDEAALEFLMGDHPAMSVGAYLERAGLNPARHSAEIKAAGFVGGKTAVVLTHHRENLRQLFMLVRRPLLAATELERRRLKAYADTLVDWDVERCGVVDIGWHGSLQTSLSRVLGLEPAQLNGYYLGLHVGASHGTSDRRAFLDEGRLRDFLTYHNTLRRCVEVFELFSAETAGSIIGLQEGKDGTFTALREPAYLLEDTLTYLEAAQDALVERLQHDAGGRKSRRRVLRDVGRLMSRPTYEEATCLGDIVHQEGFGGFGRVECLACPRYSKLGYLHHVSDFAWDVRKTFWRSGFMARLRG